MKINKISFINITSTQNRSQKKISNPINFGNQEDVFEKKNDNWYIKTSVDNFGRKVETFYFKNSDKKLIEYFYRADGTKLYRLSYDNQTGKLFAKNIYDQNGENEILQIYYREDEKTPTKICRCDYNYGTRTESFINKDDLKVYRIDEYRVTDYYKIDDENKNFALGCLGKLEKMTLFVEKNGEKQKITITPKYRYKYNENNIKDDRFEQREKTGNFNYAIVESNGKKAVIKATNTEYWDRRFDDANLKIAEIFGIDEKSLKHIYSMLEQNEADGVADRYRYRRKMLQLVLEDEQNQESAPKP